MFSSCEDVTTPDLGSTKESQWLQFGNEAISGTESGGDIIVPVQFAAGSNPDGLEVGFTVVASSPTGYTITPSNNKIIIAAGEFVSNIVITPIDNSYSNDNITFEITFDNPSLPVGLAGQGLKNKETTVTILDDDCALVLEDFYGTYSAKEFGYCDGCYEVTVSAGPVAGTLLVSNLYETGGTTVIELDNTDPSDPFVKYRSVEFDAPLQVNDTYGNVWANAFTSTTKSTFRTCDKFMDLFFRMTVSIGSFAGEVHIQLTKK